MDAIRKMTLMPARRLEARVPAMKTKGRLRMGADADITIVDAAQSHRSLNLSRAGARRRWACVT